MSSACSFSAPNAKSFDQWAKQRGRAAYPVGQGWTLKLHAFAPSSYGPAADGIDTAALARPSSADKLDRVVNRRGDPRPRFRAARLYCWPDMPKNQAVLSGIDVLTDRNSMVEIGRASWRERV